MYITDSFYISEARMTFLAFTFIGAILGVVELTQQSNLLNVNSVIGYGDLALFACGIIYSLKQGGINNRVDFKTVTDKAEEPDSDVEPPPVREPSPRNAFLPESLEASLDLGLNSPL